MYLFIYSFIYLFISIQPLFHLPSLSPSHTLSPLQAVVEYSEITKEDAESVDEKTGLLKYNTGNICIHAFSVSFLEKLAKMCVWETMEVRLFLLFLFFLL